MSTEQLNGISPRRAFLGTLASGAALVGVSMIPSPLHAEASVTEEPGKADVEAWFNKIKGKHRMVFDATWQHMGFPFAWAKVFHLTNNETGFADNQLGTVVVLRHDAIPFAMEDRLWEKYKLGELFKVEDPQTKAASMRNLYNNPPKGELIFDDMSLNELQKKGVLFCVCEMAIKVYSGFYAKANNAKQEEVEADWRSGILPGIQPVPSGVWAINRAQEHGCSYCFAG